MKNLKETKMKLKKPLKERQIEALIGNIGKWNRYMVWCRRKDRFFKADLRWANLSGANLSEANLSGANLSGANLDFSSLPLWCGSLKMKTDAKQRKQIAYHLASLFVNSEEPLTDEEKQLLDVIKPYANQFHRVGECDRIILNKNKNDFK